jgi:hypothetical protein
MSKFNAQEIIDNHGGKCKTRDGGDAVIYAVYPNQKAAIHGAISFAPCGNMSEWSWLIDGRGLGAKDSPDDLIMPRTVVAELWAYLDSRGVVRSISNTHLPDPNGHDYKTIKSTLYSDETVESEVVI